MVSDYIKTMREKIGHNPMIMPTAGVIIYKDNKVLLQKRADNGDWAMHGGGMDPNENTLETLRRELKEELNIEPINPELLGIFAGEDLYHEYPNGDKVYIITNAFLCEDFKGEIKFNDHEVLEVKWFPIDELPENLFHVDKRPIESVKEFLKTRKPILE